MTNADFGFKFETQCFVGRPHLVHLQNVASYHTVTIEFYGASGGIYRYFPRGRNDMKVHFKHSQPGKTLLVAVARPKNLIGQLVRHSKFDVQAATAAPAQSPYIGDDAEDDAEWEQKMLDIDLRFAFEEAPVLQAEGKPPQAEPFHPNQPAATSSRIGLGQQALDPGQLLQDRLESRLLSRFNKE